MSIRVDVIAQNIVAKRFNASAVAKVTLLNVFNVQLDLTIAITNETGQM